MKIKKVSFITLLCLLISFQFSFAQEQELETVIQKGHLGAVKYAEFSPDGKFIVTGGRDKSARLWEVSTGREMRTFLGHDGTVRAIKFAPDGKTVATGSTDKMVKLWNIETGKLIRTFTMKDRVTSMDFTSDGKYIVIGGYEFRAKIFETESGKFIREFKVSPNKGTGTGVSVQISKDNKHILVSEDNRKSSIFNFETGEKITTLNSVDKGFCGGCGTFSKYTPDGNYIIQGTNKGPLDLWDLKSGKKVKTYIKEQTKEVSSVDITSDGKYVLLSDKNNVYIFNKDSKKKIKSIKAHEKQINSTCFSPDGKYFLTSSDDGTAVMRRTTTGKIVRTYEGYVNKSNKGTKLDQENYWDYYAKTYFDRKTNVQISPDGKLLVIGKLDSTAKVLEFETGKTAFNLVGHSAAVICFDFSPDGKMIATGSADKTVKLWDTQTGKLIRSIKAARDMIYSLNFSEDGNKILTSGWDGNAHTWDIETGEEINLFRDIRAFSSNFSPIGNYIVVGSTNKSFKLYEADSKEIFRTMVGHSDVVSSFDFTPDGKTMVSGSWDGTVRVWDVISGFQIRKIVPKQGQIHSVKLSNYGKYIFTGGNDGNIKMWDLSTGKLLKTFEGHNSAVTNLQLSPDNESLVSCSLEGVVKVWEIVNAKIIYTYYQLNKKDWFVKARGGFFDGNAEAKKNIYFVKGLKTFHVDQFFEDFYRPGLLQHAYQTRGLINENINLYDYLEKSPPPSVRFNSTYNDSVFESDLLNVDFQLTDNGGGINEIKVMHNGKRIVYDFKHNKKPKIGKKVNQEFQLLLVPGENTVSVSAFSNGRIESNVVNQRVTFKTEADLNNCYVLAVGIDKYENETLNLNYAKADAKAFSDIIKKRSKGLFSDMVFYDLYDKNATSENIINAINKISEQANPEDVFIFYYAGHGSMIDKDFYFIPTDCIRLYDTEMLKKSAILASYMQEQFNKIKALKQLMILDACQSGGAAEVLGQRGAGREKAIAQLSRSTGIHVLASAGSEQYAIEFKSLGHGLFTYILLDAIGGSADGAPLDGKITIYELKSYLDDRVPEYTQKFKGSRQFPHSYSGGNDFPLVIDNN